MAPPVIAIRRSTDERRAQTRDRQRACSRSPDLSALIGCRRGLGGGYLVTRGPAAAGLAARCSSLSLARNGALRGEPSEAGGDGHRHLPPRPVRQKVAPLGPSCRVEPVTRCGDSRLRLACMLNNHPPSDVNGFTEFEEAFFRAGELLSETEMPLADVEVEPIRRRWAPWR